MRLQYFLSMAALIVPLKLFALDCYLSVVKNSCWSNYEVDVDILKPDASGTVLFSAKVPKDKQWARIKVKCQPGQRFYARSQMFPVFWESEKGKYYYLKRYWALPKNVDKDTTALHVPICFPKAFSGVPLPPDATGNCKCDFDQLPPLELKK